ncbi:glycosyltransferase family 9 protein [Crocinitomix catalasitica]|nr:glycosyltransferase family 9 protein [Crocinitomix catalasitica]
MKIENPRRIIISRTDSIGDVILTLPLCGILREKYPDTELIFLGKEYTNPIINCCPHVDKIWDWTELENKSDDDLIGWLKDQDVDVFLHVFPRKNLANLIKKTGIDHRIGTSHRLYHRFTCNHRPSFTRKRSDLHEAQLNTKLLLPFGIEKEYSLDELTAFAAFKFNGNTNAKANALLRSDKQNIILHPKSQGSAVEWPLEHYLSLTEVLDPQKFEIFFTGTEKEAEYFRNQLPKKENVHDLSGKLSLSELIDFIGKADCLIAASTGPLHIAGFCGIKAIGLFSAMRPIHSGRWKPLGINTLVFEDKKNLKSPQPLEIDFRVIVQEVRNEYGTSQKEISPST